MPTSFVRTSAEVSIRGPHATDELSFIVRVAGALAATAMVAALAACAVAPIAPDTPYAVVAQPIAPWEVHEDCADVTAGDRIDFRFDASKALDFDLYYRQGIAVIIPLSRKNVTTDAGVFEVEIPGRYCLAWKAGASGGVVSYHVTVHSARQ
ncbi:MAG TPA: hypothetical protein VIL19_06740 [Casimicrobiaceae bacterium]